MKREAYFEVGKNYYSEIRDTLHEIRGKMGLLFNLLGAPLVGPIKLTQWVAEKIKEVADQRLGDEEKLKSELIELQMMREMDEIGQEEFERKEKEILDAINAAKVASRES